MPRDVTQIVLTKKEISLLKQMKKARIIETASNKNELIPLLQAGVARQDQQNWREVQKDLTIPAVFAWSITTNGEHFLVYRREQRKRLFIIPIAVSILTTIILRLLEWLLPLAAEWLSSILS